MPPALQHLSFDLGEDAQGLVILEAVASTRPAQHAAVLAEVHRLLDWAWHHHPDTHGPIEDGNTWHHNLQVVVEPGDWHAVTLTLAGSREWVDALLAAFRIDPSDSH